MSEPNTETGRGMHTAKNQIEELQFPGEEQEKESLHAGDLGREIFLLRPSQGKGQAQGQSQHSIVIMFNHTILYSSQFLTDKILNVLTIKKEKKIYGT